jgi:hypothetical protein
MILNISITKTTLPHEQLKSDQDKIYRYIPA